MQKIILFFGLILTLGFNSASAQANKCDATQLALNNCQVACSDASVADCCAAEKTSLNECQSSGSDPDATDLEATQADNETGSRDPSQYRGVIPVATEFESNSKITCSEVGEGSSIGAKIHCGSVSLNDFPVLLVYLVQWILTIAGALAVIMIMIGGFQYMLGGLTDDKERGKKTLIYALAGLIVSFMAWWIVELIQVWLTS